MSLDHGGSEDSPSEKYPTWYIDCVQRGEDALMSLRERKPPSLLYHYTAAAGLLGILKSQTMFASDSRYVNDSQELGYGRQVVERVLSRHIDFRRAQELSHGVRNGLSKIEMFVASFSEEPDVLSQWRAYAADGLGYSLGLRSAEHLCIQEKPIAFLPVLYEEEEQDALVEGILLPALKSVDPKDERASYSLQKACSEAMQFVLPVLKNPGFVEEREWRLVIPTRWWTGAAPSVFTPSRFGITPHVELVPSTGKIPLGALYLGPKIDRELGKNAAFELLHFYKYEPRLEEIVAPADVVVAFSSTSYR